MSFFSKLVWNPLYLKPLHPQTSTITKKPINQNKGPNKQPSKQTVSNPIIFHISLIDPILITKQNRKRQTPYNPRSGQLPIENKIFTAQTGEFIPSFVSNFSFSLFWNLLKVLMCLRLSTSLMPTNTSNHNIAVRVSSYGMLWR